MKSERREKEQGAQVVVEQSMASVGANYTPANVGPVVGAFLNTLNSPETRRKYRAAVELALEELGELRAVTPAALADYRGRLVARLEPRATARLSPSSVSLQLAALRSFFRFCRLTGQTRLTDEMIHFALKSPSATVVRPYQVLTADERRRLLRACRGNLRDRLLLALALATGLRAAELCALQVRDLIDDDDGRLLLRVRQGKGRKDRLVPLDRDVTAEVRRFLREVPAIEYLFSSPKGAGGRNPRPLSTARFRQLLADYRRIAGIDKPVSPHTLRHTAAMNWARHGAPVTGVQKLLGHASLETTQKYLDHMTLDDLKAIVEEARK